MEPSGPWAVGGDDDVTSVHANEVLVVEESATARHALKRGTSRSNNTPKPIIIGQL